MNTYLYRYIWTYVHMHTKLETLDICFSHTRHRSVIWTISAVHQIYLYIYIYRYKYKWIFILISKRINTFISILNMLQVSVIWTIGAVHQIYLYICIFKYVYLSYVYNIYVYLSYVYFIHMIINTRLQI
jgi:hypothetical protein